MQHYYAVHGLRLAISVTNFEDRDPIGSYVAPFATPLLPAIDYLIAIRRGPVHVPPPSAEVLHEGELLPGLPAIVARAGAERWLLVPNLLSICSHAWRNTSEIWAGEACGAALLSYAGIHVIDAALASSGQFLLHGAALALPEPQRSALLLFAPSGAGKTTAALALALHGFGLMTDDAIVLCPGGAYVWGLPRPLKVHRDTAALLPALLPALGQHWDSEGEQPLSLAAASKIARVTGPEALTVGGILMLGPRSSGAHRIAPMEKTKALVLLSGDNLRHIPGGAGPEQAVRFGALAELLQPLPVYELNTGAPLASLGDYVADHLAAASHCETV